MRSSLFWFFTKKLYVRVAFLNFLNFGLAKQSYIMLCSFFFLSVRVIFSRSLRFFSAFSSYKTIFAVIRFSFSSDYSRFSRTTHSGRQYFFILDDFELYRVIVSK